ncbi:menaquinone biosynthetic enzyme MqnA/MqnD family protein [Leptospira sp. GIMC2001]|uniref:menaquinone biosynthetic enzyme MqnA/MqnD family protein n=1 Tax=Leptospira sp. GIMC2001 TaxID=1513297 RepID=UPI0023496A28|nr:MqnA/MqnD/SBP family protein [Leptospira sp. GIMC2001]WCL47978.1 ABC transporter substrate-binding protein [Leptospira sp. GIMC2001]
MRVGVVKSLNARPLTWGFEKDNTVQKVYDTPKVLAEMLVAGELDTALISSVECLRHSDSLQYSLSVGVCARTGVRSILYYKNLTESFPPSMISVDSGSRTSVALLELLFLLETGKKVITQADSPENIMKEISKGSGHHMLFGDNALNCSFNSDIFQVRDIAEWWFSLTGLHFIFALWAYPKAKPIEDKIFVSSLEYGLQNIDEIISSEKKFDSDFVRNYLQRELHYIPDQKSLQGFEKFSELLRSNNLL